MPWFRSAAVGLAVACALVLGIVPFVLNGVQPGNDQQLPVIESSFETAVGERSTVVLADDSVVTLNTDSLVEVPYVRGGDVRRADPRARSGALRCREGFPSIRSVGGQPANCRAGDCVRRSDRRGPRRPGDVGRGSRLGIRGSGFETPRPSRRRQNLPQSLPMPRPAAWHPPGQYSRKASS